MKEPVKITVQGVLEDLENGLTRNANDPHYKGEGQSIGEKYGLNKSQVSDLFKHEKLKGRKVKKEKIPAFILIDEEDTTTQVTLEGAITEAEPEQTVDVSSKATEESEEADTPDWLAE
jgi:hypothetical protein